MRAEHEDLLGLGRLEEPLHVLVGLRDAPARRVAASNVTVRGAARYRVAERACTRVCASDATEGEGNTPKRG
eukprot:3667455-Prymnesium_polylepis.1